MKRALLPAFSLLVLSSCSKLDEITSSPPTPMPTASIEATPSAVRAGEEVTLTVSSENGQVGLITPIGVSMLNGTLVVTPQQTTNYIFSVDGEGGTIHSSVLVEVLPAPPPEASIEARPSTIKAGETATLTVTSTDADQGLIAPIGVFILNGVIPVTPEHTTTYFFSVSGPGGTVFVSTSVVVETDPDPPQPRPTAAITAAPMTIQRGEVVTLTVASTDADQGVVVPTATAMLNGQFTDTPDYTTTYIFIVDGPGGSAFAAVTVEVIQPPPPPRPTATIEATPTKIDKPGKPVVLTVASTNADSGLLVPPGTSILNGEVTVYPSRTTTYLFAVDGPGGSAHAAVTVEVGY